MKKYVTAPKLVVVLALVACSICLFSFRQTDTTQQKTFRKGSTERDNDTSTSGKRNSNKNEFRMDELDAAMKQLDAEMSKLDLFMKNLDFQRMEHEIDGALEKIDTRKIEKELKKTVAKTDFKKAEAEMKQAFTEARKINTEQMKREMETMKEQLKKHQKEIKLNTAEIQKNVKKAMENTKVSIEKTKAEIKVMEEFTDELEKDGLIDKNKPFKIEIKEGELYLNDKKQSKEVSDKYRKYYKKENFTISNGSNKKVYI